MSPPSRDGGRPAPLRERTAPAREVAGFAAALLGAVLLAAGCGGDAGDREATSWSVPDAEGCQGLTVGWPVDREALRPLIGPDLTPVEGPTPGTGTLLLFAAECTGSRIDGEPTDAFVTAHVLVPVEPPNLPGGLLPDGTEAPPRWVAVPRTLGPVDSPVRALFEEGGFPTSEARTDFELKPGDGEGLDARFSIATQAGASVTVEATFEDSLAPFEGRTGLVSTTEGPTSIATGPESASRYEAGTATVTSEGTSFLDGIDLRREPPFVSLDRHFRWSFTFRSATIGGAGESSDGDAD